MRRPQPSNLLIIAAIWAVVAVLFATQSFIGSHYVVRPLSWGHAFAVAFLVWSLRAVGAIPAYLLAARFPFRSTTIVKAAAVHVPASIAIAVAEQMVYSFVLTHTTWFGGAVPSPVEVQMNVAVYWVVVGVAHGVRYYSDARRDAVAAARLQSQLAAARLDLLQGQLQPHFLFNTLNDIAELIHEDAERADAMLTNLAELLRSSLRGASSRETTLRDELAFLKRYLDIVRMRFSDRLTVRVDVPDDLLEARVPSLLLQPIVENAVRHGVARRDGSGLVAVTAHQRHGRLYLEVSDDGPGIVADSTRGTGVGLANTRERLREQFGAAALFELRPGRSGVGATAVIELPLSMAHEPETGVLA
jgi:two-component system LytT family sensor kinase